MIKFLKKDLTPYLLIAFAIIFAISLFVSYNRPLSYSISVGDNPVVDQPVSIEIDIEKQMTAYSPEYVGVELTHKYNTNESYQFELDPYDTGKYEFIFTPRYSDTYILNLTLTSDGKSQSFSENIEIGQ